MAWQSFLWLGRASRLQRTHVKVVVTGGAGFIGTNLCRALVRNPRIDEVLALDDFSAGYATNLASVPVSVVEGTILDPEALDHCFRDADAIVHLAARPSVPQSLADPMGNHRVNASGQRWKSSRRHDEPGTPT